LQIAGHQSQISSVQNNPRIQYEAGIWNKWKWSSDYPQKFAQGILTAGNKRERKPVD